MKITLPSLCTVIAPRSGLFLARDLISEYANQFQITQNSQKVKHDKVIREVKSKDILEENFP